MKRTLKSVFVIAALSLSASTQAQGTTTHLSQASSHAAASVADLSLAGVKGAAVVVAVPLLAVGAVGEAGAATGGSLMALGSQPIGTPLQITEETLTELPNPAEAMRNGGMHQ